MEMILSITVEQSPGAQAEGGAQLRRSCMPTPASKHKAQWSIQCACPNCFSFHSMVVIASTIMLLL